ncbi:MAG: 2OG-Fe(II) oxygenase [Proteobacteria bacterium]|nr:2OG-Fe(II) oxygenase [Pseudomonadota bacterium]
MNKDASHFLSSWQHTLPSSNPYLHYFVKNIFRQELLNQLQNLPFKAYDLDYKLGRREEFNSYRQYFNPEITQAYPCAKHVADAFLDPSIISFIEQEGQCSLKDSSLRIEYTLDKEKFWLEPHTDIGEKLFTMVIYLSNDKDSQDWGTDIYCDANTYHSTVPYEENSAVIFFPSEISWHGFRPRAIHGIRKTLIVNYVTQAWRSRHELVHPNKTVQELLA